MCDPCWSHRTVSVDVNVMSMVLSAYYPSAADWYGI